MSSLEPSLSEIPLVETSPGSPAYELLAAVRDPESDAMYREIWSEFSSTLLPVLESLGGIKDPAKLKKELHGIRGMSSQFGLFLLEVTLFAWEIKSADPVGDMPRFLPKAKTLALLSIQALEKAFPHLKDTDC